METQNEIIVTVCPKCTRHSPPLEEIGNHRYKTRLQLCGPCAKIEYSTKWDELCPPAFKDTIVDKLPDQPHTRQALGWKRGPIGLLLTGPTRAGKSRTAWEIIRKCVFSGVRCSSVDLLKLNRVVLNYGYERSAIETLEHWITSPVLLMDDLFKIKMTERVEEQVFMIVDERIQRKLPMIITTNDTGETLISRLTPDRGMALVARLIESCSTIPFEVP